MQNKLPLALRPIGWTGTGLDMRTWTDVYHYEVVYLPAGEQAWIARMNGDWQILRCTNGVQGDWTGKYASHEHALDALEKELCQ